VGGLLDWYWLGVVLGLGVADGIIGREARRPWPGIATAALVGGAFAIAFVALEWWAFVAFVGVALVSGLALRRLSSASRLAASLAAVVIAFIPVLGYALAVGAPIAGVRLGRRAGSRFAGLRVLAKD
jgi:hypothetical protein